LLLTGWLLLTRGVSCLLLSEALFLLI